MALKNQYNKGMIVMAENKDAYIQFVQTEASKLGKIFILDSGEGNDFEYSKTGWYVEDLSGWLIDISLKDKLIKDIDNKMAYKTFSEEYIFVKWYLKENDELAIQFKKYSDI